MTKITFTQDEINEMVRVYNVGHQEWQRIAVDSIKEKIKSEKIARQNGFCCYCRRDIHSEFKMVLDIEHVIPKSKLKKHMFSSKNLSVSCKRCNMKIKGEDVSFLSVPLNDLPKRIFRTKLYKIIHPNLDRYTKHLDRIVLQIGDGIMVKYFIRNGSEKGRFTRNYFKLSELERNTFNVAQGGRSSEINNQILMFLFDGLHQ
ncbi:HNH endonuclease [Aeromonas rivipollensis]|uniref:HNH endonuclease n=1 Tax=Aeromonas rivipollensis TaxID=948519 RepID=A0AAW9YFY0_9GAMM|nr:HNH endonuclease [Aeromonas rivipollensis]NEX76699.1 HNH endonuclease [Aeromonas rivipollensis]